MDVGGSFLELACIRIAIVPASPMSDERFAALAAQIAALDHLPSNALPKSQKPPHRSFLSAASAHAQTYTGIPADFRSFIAGQASSAAPQLPRSRSLTPATTPARRTHSLSPPRGSAASPPPASGSPPVPQPPVSSSSSAASAPVASPGAGGASPWPAAGPDAGEAEAALRLRYITVHRDGSGSLLVRPPSEWDAFQSRRVWGVVGVVDRAAPGTGAGGEEAEKAALADARVQFAAALAHFKGAAVSRLIVFTTPDAVRDGGAFVTTVSDAGVDDSGGGGGAVPTATVIVPDGERGLKPAAATSSIDAAAAAAVAAGAGSSSTLLSGTSRAVFAAAAAVGGEESGIQQGASSVGVSSSTLSLGSSVGDISASYSSLPAASPTSAATADMMRAPGAGDVGGHPISVGFVPLSSKGLQTRLEVRAQIVHFAGLLLAALETWMEHESIGKDIFLSPLDERNPTDKQSKLVKRRQGRLEKLQGDYLLLTGSTSDALAKFNSAIERSKANGDSLWLACAMEGAAAAQVYSHVAAGGKVDDPALIARLIEQYGEIYKLYRKKRVPELEAAAAVRLAEFLGRWTPRRKDALDAVEHAATVGESLRASKKQALWEALARFCERLGSRRKAALFLYRLGVLDASQDLWGKAVTLMTASASQFRVAKGGCVVNGTWPDLHRQVLLEAARAGRCAGDTTEAARHSVEALALSPVIFDTTGDPDSVIVEALRSGGRVSAWLPCAEELIEVVELAAIQMGNLSVQVREPNTAGVESAAAGAGGVAGPFIYNPFAVRAAAAEQAEANRAVTWVCGETAHISLALRNRLRTRLPVEIVAVSIAENGEEECVWPTSSFWEDEAADDASADEHAADAGVTGLSNPAGRTLSGIKKSLNGRTRKMHETLRAIGDVVTTVSQTVEVAPRQSEPMMRSYDSVFVLSVVPKKTGSMRICGIVLRLFSGAIVMLPAPKVRLGGSLTPPIEVMAPLPNLGVSIEAAACDSAELTLTQVPIELFEGEHHSLRVWISNNGADAIAMASIRATTNKPDLVHVHSGHTDIAVQSSVAALKRGEAQHFDIQVYTLRSAKGEGDVGGNNMPAVKVPNDASITVDVKYTGKRRGSHFRTTAASLSVVVSPAVVVEKLSHVGYFVENRLPSVQVPDQVSAVRTASPAMEGVAAANGAKASETLENGIGDETGLSPSTLGLLIDVRANAAAPVHVSVVMTDEKGRVSMPERGPSRSALRRHEEWVELEAYRSCLLDHTSCARLLAPLHVAMPRSDPGPGSSDSLRSANDKAPGFALKWSIPTLGRRGVVPLFEAEVGKVLSDSFVSPAKEQHALALSPNSASAFRTLSADVDVVVSADSGDASYSRQVPCTQVTTRRFYGVTIKVRNTGIKMFPPNCSLDVHVCQRDGRGGSFPVSAGSMVGAHEGVACGNLAPGDVFSHNLRLRLASAGLFDVVVGVYCQEASSNTSGVEEFLSLRDDDTRKDTTPFVSFHGAAVARSSSPSGAGTGLQISASLSQPASFAAPPAVSSASEAGAASQPHRASLKRVGLSRRRRSVAGERSLQHSPHLTLPEISPISANAVRPFVADSIRGNMLSMRSQVPIATGALSVQSVNDTRWSSGLLHPLAPPASKSLGDVGESFRVPVDAGHHPDTIVR